MEVFFLDVAQGTCQVILLGGRRAIIIDCGLKNERTVLQFLKRAGVEHLDCLIVSHSHKDHVGGAVAILGAYQDRISKIGFVQDHLFLESVFWARISELLDREELAYDQLVRLETTKKPQLVWSDNTGRFQLQTYSPSPGENLKAQENKKPNPTSAVLFLKTYQQRIIFAADSEVKQWREIHRKARKKLSCDILAVPHHGGKTHDNLDDLHWMLDEAVTSDIAIISVGTSNTHGHPRQDVIQAITQRGIKVMCTQFTKQCNSGSRNLEHIRPGVLKPQLLIGRSSASKDLTKAKHSRNVACAGSIKVNVETSGLVIDRFDDHQKAVDELANQSIACPLCRLSP